MFDVSEFEFVALLIKDAIHLLFTTWPIDFKKSKKRHQLELEKLEAEIRLLEAQTVKVRLENLRSMLDIIDAEHSVTSLPKGLKSTKKILRAIRK